MFFWSFLFNYVYDIKFMMKIVVSFMEGILYRGTYLSGGYRGLFYGVLFNKIVTVLKE